jgi:hypothetical protein
VYPVHFEEEAFQKYMDNYQAKVQAKIEENELEMKYNAEICSELSDDFAEAGKKTDITTSTHKANFFSSMNLVRLILHPIQIELGKVVTTGAKM